MLYGHLLGNLLPLLIRVLFRRQSKTAIIFYCVSAALSQFLYQHLKRMGTPRRDSTGNIVSPGDDLNQPGMTEWTFDVLYISCELINRHHVGICPLIVHRVCPSRLCHSGRMVLVDIHCGMTYNFCHAMPLTLVLKIPIFVIYKLWSVLISPMLLGRSPSVDDEEPRKEGLSKRQEKLKKRSDRGDPRVKMQARK